MGRILKKIKIRVIKSAKFFLSKLFQITIFEQWRINDRIIEAYKESSYYIPYKKFHDNAVDTDIKCIAFYLPQFHTFAENDRFWGKGFTEWLSVSRAVPLFDGHNQPRVPGELGFYDLRGKDVIKKQIELAKNYGIYGFCFHYYWFNGRAIMRTPLNHILADQGLDIPFCLHWANEPWTRRWDGAEGNEVLLEQRHTPEDDLDFIKNIETALTDRRYIKIDGRPLLIIYRPNLFSDIRATITRWKNYCEVRGIPRLYLVVAHTHFDGKVDPREYGFDAAVEYPPHNIDLPNMKDTYDLLYSNFKGSIQSYSEIMRDRLAEQRPPYTLFRGIVPDFDCTARRKDPIIYAGASPLLYRRWLEGIIKYTRRHLPGKERLIFINAWNEWAEGAYLEPDKRNGYAYLTATHQAITKKCLPRIAVIAHVFHEESANEFISYLKNITQPFDIYISTGIQSKEKIHSLLIKAFDSPNILIDVRAVQNRGRDMIKFIEFRNVYRKYDYICWVLSKKRTRSEVFYGWRRYSLNNLLGTQEIVDTILTLFQTDNNLGLIFPEHIPPVQRILGWGNNFGIASNIASKLNISLDRHTPFDFPAGSMFWFRPIALKPIFEMKLSCEDFEKKSQNNYDGTLAHALERMILFVVAKEGFHWKKVIFTSWDRAVHEEYEK